MKALALLIPCAVLIACGRAQTPPAADAAGPIAASPATAQVVLFGASDTSTSGELTLTSTTGGVSIAGTVTGLTPATVHGFHVHEIGDCSAPDAKSAGDHFNPAHAAHGGPMATPRHLGDLPNVESDGQGRAVVAAAVEGATLRDGGANDLMGRALVVHANPDDYLTQPSGDSGDRIACGVIR